jgi:2-keto-3-deoxy-L-rhamnonate aldolase RhmA
MEIEAWFLAEWHHFAKIDSRLSTDFILQECGFDLQNVDVEKRPHPTQDLQDIYQLIGSNYDKSEGKSQEIINYLDYEFLYLDLTHSVKQLKKLIDEINSFLVR